MNYEWSIIKEKLNIAKHKITFEEAKSVFSDEYGLVLFDGEHSENEERFLLLGMSDKIEFCLWCIATKKMILSVSFLLEKLPRKRENNTRSVYEKRI